jgi:hypothetical protein
MPSRNENGRALPAKFRFYVPGSTLSTPAVVYTDDTLTVPHDFPILSDSAGRWPPIWADETQTFDVGWTDQVFDAEIRVFTGVTPAEDAVLASASIADAAATSAAISAADAATSEADAANEAASAAASAAQAAAYAAAISGAPFFATSATSLTIGTGAKTLTLDQLGKLFSIGQNVVIAETSAPATVQMTGVVTAFDGSTGAMSVTISSTLGAGTHTDWTISLTASAGSGVAATRQVATAGLATGGGDLTADLTITVTAAAASDVLTGTDTTKATHSKALSDALAFFALTDAATVAWDTNSGINAKVTLGGNRLIGAPTHLKDGWTYTLDLKQDATGTRVPTWDAIWDWGVAGAPTLSTAAGKKDKVVAQYSADSGKLEANFRKSA